MYRIGVAGVCGKMGKRIAHFLIEDDKANFSACFEVEGHPDIGKDLGEVLGSEKMGIEVTSGIDSIVDKVDCIIDFTLPVGTFSHVAKCKEKRVAIVIGTTGIDEKGEEKIKEAAETIPVVFSPNMAIGVNLFFNIIKEVARVFGKNSEITIDETHHVHKKDSPSGTAKRIAKVVKEVTDETPKIEAFREGEVIGNHGIVFDGQFETIEIRHDAKTRDVFANGAIKAALYLEGKKTGFYDMRDVLGLKKD